MLSQLLRDSMGSPIDSADVLAAMLSQTPERVSVEERIRRYVAMMPAAVSGDGGHAATFDVVRVLLHGFGLSPEEAYGYMQEYNARCSPPWSDSDLMHKLRSANFTRLAKARGHLLAESISRQGNPSPKYMPTGEQRKAAGMYTESEARNKVEFDLDKLRAWAAPWSSMVDLRWLANRSSEDPSQVTPDAFLRALYGDERKVLVFTDAMSQGEALWPDDALPEGGPQGVWFLAQPVSGERVPNPRNEGRLSRRIAEACVDFRYMVIESDSAPIRDWLGFIVQCPLRVEALYTSGSRSVHALVRVDCKTKSQWDDEKAAMMPFLMGALMAGADRGTWSAVRLTRLPGCWRAEKKSWQKLLYLRPNAPLRRICDLPAVRDVEADWLKRGRAEKEVGDPESLQGVYRALGYYSNVSKPCADLLSELRAYFK